MLQIVRRAFHVAQIMRPAAMVFILFGCLRHDATAQTPPPAAPPRERPMLSTELPIQALTDMPASSNLYSLLEMMQADLISDRMDTGGLGMGQPARIGAHGSSWTQTQFRIGDVNITDPTGSGTPLFMPGVLEWGRVDVQTGLMPIDINAPGLAITLTPRRPSATWTRSIEGFIAPPGLQSGRTLASPPSIERINRWQDGSLFLSGPLSNKVGLVFVANVGSSSRFERTDLTSLDSAIASAFAHIVFTRNAHEEVRFVGTAQRSSYPYAHHVAFGQRSSTEHDTSGTGQATWERRIADGLSWRMFAGFASRKRTPRLEPTKTFVMERLREGPVNELLTPGDGREQTGSIGAHLTPAPFEAGGHHMPQLGVTASLNRTSSVPSFSGRIGELINGEPARAWDFTSTGVESQWHSINFAAYAGDHIQLLPRVVADLGLRFEHIGGSAKGGATGVAWNDLFPRASIRWDITRILGLSAFFGYARYGDQLPLNWLAYGDPNAATGSVYRWTGATSASAVLPRDVGALVSRVGPGTGGNPAFSAIDPGLKRPHMDEATFGFESRPGARTVMRLTATARRTRQMVGLMDTTVNDSSYSPVYIEDPGWNETTQQLVGYNRLPASFGRDQYLLTNPANDETNYVGVDITGQTQTEHLFFLLGATAGRANGYSANRGFQAIENDYDVIGEVFTNPNARTYAKGRDFTDRGYTIKLSTIYEFPKDIHFGFMARYQDGQHFTRNVIFEGLNQGPEAVRAFLNGRARFTFVMSIDARLRKGFTIGGHRFDAILDAYNVANQLIQVEEYDVTSPIWRRTTAVQPPRVIHLGLRYGF
jgi:hypothetical protein